MHNRKSSSSLVSHRSPFTTHQSLFFVHGWGTDSTVWKYQVEEFSKNYNIFAINLPGHSAEDEWRESSLGPAVDKIVRFTAHRSPLSDFVGIGWSLGGQVLMETAAQHPHVFKALILIGSTPCFVARRDFPAGQPPGVAKRMLKDLKKDFAKTMSRFYPLNFTDEELKQADAADFLRYYQKNFANHLKGNAIKALEALLSSDHRETLSRITIPVLIIHGEQDQVCPVEAAHFLARNFSDARLEVFKNTGHAPFLTKREEFYALVKNFLEDMNVQPAPLIR